MSSNPPDPNELIRLLLQQTQQRQNQQQQNQQQAQHALQQGQVQTTSASISQSYQGAGMPSNSGGTNPLGSLIAQYLKAAQGQGQPPPAAAPSPAVTASLMANSPPHVLLQAAAPNQLQMGVGASNIMGGQQNLMALSGLLSSINQNLASAVTQQFGHQSTGFAPFQSPSQQHQNGSVQNPIQPLQHQQGLLQHQQSLLQHQQRQGQDQPTPMEAANSASSIVNPNLANVTNSQKTTAHLAVSSHIGVDSSNKAANERSPPQPVSLATLQTWNLEQLESHAQHLMEFNRPVPKIVRILLDDARRQEEKREAKRLSNRKSATISRARKKQLIDELSADNARLRRQAIILSYLPDPVVAIDMDGKIKFCNKQIERVLKHKEGDLIGANIKDIIVPESRNAICRLIHDLVAVERVSALRGEGGTDSGSADFVSSDQSFSVLEVNLNSQENMSDSSGDPSGKKDTRQTKVSFCSRSVTASAAEDSSEPPAKKSKTTWASSSDSKASNGVTVDTGMNVDDVMGASVTANNASAKLSSLMHKKEDDKKPYAVDDITKLKKEGDRESPTEEIQPHIHRKHGLAPAPQKQDSRSSSSSTESDGRTRNGINSSEDSGYMDSNSAGSSDESPGDSSDSFWKNGNRPRPLAPGAIIRLICSDLTTVWCELTSSIRTRATNDEDPQLGIVDINPKALPKSNSNKEEEPPTEEKEVLICFRPIRIGEKVGEELRFPQVSESSNANESAEST